MDEYKKWGLIINAKKIEENLKINNEEIKKVNKFKYLGSISDSDGKIYCDIEKRMHEKRKVIDILNAV